MNIVYGYICDQVIFHTGLNGLEFVAAIVILSVTLLIAVKKLRQESSPDSLVGKDND